MSDGILIVGGYGAVGTVIATTLAKQHAHQIIIAGRTEARAAKLATELGRGVGWRRLDVTGALDYDAVFADVRCMVMCLDVPNIEFVRQCLLRGMHYVDISAEYPILTAIKGLDDTARQYGATGVLSVGLVPGLSNLMALYSLRFIDPIAHFDSAILAGLGEKHGAAGSGWILNHLSDSTGTTHFMFREPYGHKPVHRFAFSDQYSLTQTLPIQEAATWLGFDSFLMTRLVGLARVPVLRSLFQRQAIQEFLLNMTQRWQFGSDEFVLTTRACGETSSYQAWLRGKREAVVTGLVAAEVTRRLVIGLYPAGIFHIEQLLQLEDFLPMLEAQGVTFSDEQRHGCD